jgi:glycerophosphoryl diester phosphodiesterase
MTQISPHSLKARAKRGKIAWWQILLALVLAVIIVHACLYYVFVPAQPPVFPALKKPLNIAHQGGELLAPSNTMVAFDQAIALGVDILETDIHMTKDGSLVLIHDNTVDRTTNGSGRVDNYTLAALKKLDAGYKFQDLQGNYSYRGKGVTIPTLEELFSKYGTTSYFNLEIKDAYPQNGPSQIEAKLWDLIQKYHVEKKVVVTSFRQDLIDHFNHLAKGKVLLGAGREEVTVFVLTHKFWFPGFYRPSSSVLQIPTENSGFNLKDRNLIEGAHHLGMQVHYWTIDDKQTMKELIEMGADGIITNRPDILKELLQEMHLR